MKKPQPLHEHFSQYTSTEISRIQENVCKKNKCKYLKSRKMGGVTYCDYLCMTGISRDCMPDVCTHYNDNVEIKKKNINSVLFDNTKGETATTNNKELSKTIKKHKSTRKKSTSTKTRKKSKRKNLKSDVY